MLCHDLNGSANMSLKRTRGAGALEWKGLENALGGKELSLGFQLGVGLMIVLYIVHREYWCFWVLDLVCTLVIILFATKSFV